MESLNKIRSQIARYVDEKIDYADFRSWMVGAYAEYAGSGQESPELAVCRAVEWECAQYSEGIISEDQLRVNLRPIARPQLATADGNVQFFSDWKLGSSPTSSGSPVLAPVEVKLVAA